MIRINPSGLYIEDVVEGIGCNSHQSVVSTEYGMFWCDINGCYQMVGTELTTISEAIEPSWQADFNTPVVEFDGQRNKRIMVKIIGE